MYHLAISKHIITYFQVKIDQQYTKEAFINEKGIEVIPNSSTNYYIFDKENLTLVNNTIDFLCRKKAFFLKKKRKKKPNDLRISKKYWENYFSYYIV